MFRDRNVRNLVLARLISSAGVEASFFVGLWGRAAYEFDAGPGELAVMSALIGVASIVGSLVGGVLVDRLNPRTVLIGSEVVFLPATLSLVVVGDLWTMLGFATVSWLTGAVLETAVVSLPPRLVDDDRLEACNARLESANWLAFIIGPATGALISVTIGLRAIFVFDAITSVVALLLLRNLALRPVELAEDTDGATVPAEAPTIAGTAALPSVAADGGERGGFRGAVDELLQDLREGLAHAWARVGIRLAFYLGGLTWLGFGVFVALEPLFYRDVLDQPVETIGIMNAIFGVGMLIGSTSLERSGGRWTGFRAALVLSVFAGLGSTVYVGTDQLRWVMVGGLLWAMPLGAALPMMRTLVQRSADPDKVGRVMGAMGTVQSLAGMAPLVVAPALAVRFGVQPVLLVSGVSVALLAPLAWGVARRIDGRPDADRAPSDVVEVSGR